MICCYIGGFFELLRFEKTKDNHISEKLIACVPVSEQKTHVQSSYASKLCARG